MNKKEKALLIAQQAHGDQAYGVYPYMYHINEVVRLAESFGFDESVVVACALHDTLEDTNLSYKDIEFHFGYRVAEIVYCVTDELGRNRKERKANTYPKTKSNWRAVAVKVCDRIANAEFSSKADLSLWNMYAKEAKEFEHELDYYNAAAYNELKDAWGYYRELFYK